MAGARGAPECNVSWNSRKAIIGATSVSVVGRGLPVLPVLPTLKTTSGSSTMLSRMQKKAARQLDSDHTSLVAPANGSANLRRCMEMTLSTF